jgi:hypothetical protein
MAVLQRWSPGHNDWRVRSLGDYRHRLGLMCRISGVVTRSLGRMRAVGDKALFMVSDGRKIWMLHGLFSS